jgi:polyhydroxybutyrate depolymerase|tara:strand:+ start:845 stop:1729 length:885 start_codon:yes stop_codon:yes gene_type:complete
MLKLNPLLFSALVILASSAVTAQTIDLGRGELPLTIPENYNSATSTPLIILLHGYSSNGAGQDAYMGFSKIADRYGFILVAPDGTKESAGDNNRFWNASDACCDFFSLEVDDSAYVLSIINEVKSDYNIDANRVFLIGHSNGGFMSYRAAYDHSSIIAAIVSLAGADHADIRNAPDMPVHILQIHGTADGTIAYDGADIQGNSYPSAEESVSRWAAYNGCSTNGVTRELRDLEGRIDGHESSVLLFEEGCKTGGSSELWSIADGSHVPALSESFSQQVVEWLYAHPKTSESYSD